MNVARHRASAQAALVPLEEAVLGVMGEARSNNQRSLRSSKISDYLGIPPYNRGQSGNVYYIVANILDRLEDQGFVKQEGSGGPWVLTDKGVRKLTAE